MADRKDVFNDVKPGNQLIGNLQKKSCFISHGSVEVVENNIYINKLTLVPQSEIVAAATYFEFG